MSTSAERLYNLIQKIRREGPRPPPYYTPEDYSKKTLDRWAAENGKTKKQIYKRRWNIKKHIRIRDAKRAAAAATVAAEQESDQGGDRVQETQNPDQGVAQEKTQTVPQPHSAEQVYQEKKDQPRQNRCHAKDCDADIQL